MRFIAVKIDESNCFESDFLAKCGGKIYCIYIYDSSERTYCCEITTSYCLYMVDHVPESCPENDEDWEVLSEELLDINSHCESISYMHCRFIDNIDEDNKQLLDEGEDVDIDEMIEYYQSNPIW